MHNKQKPTVLEKAQYKQMTSDSVLNTRVIATKLDLKQQVISRLLRKHFIKYKEHSSTKKLILRSYEKKKLA